MDAEISRRLEVQRDLERLSMDMGTRRYHKSLEGAKAGKRGSVVGATRILLQEVVEPLTKALIHKHIENSHTRGVSPLVFSLFVPQWDSKRGTEQDPDRLGADVLAFLTARAVLDSIDRKAELGEAARRLALLIEHERSFRRFERLSPGLFKYRMESLAVPSYGYQVRKLSQSLAVAKCDACREAGTYGPQEACPHMAVGSYQLSGPDSLRVGTWLIDLMAQVTGLMTIETRPTTTKSGRKVTRNYIEPTEDTREWLDTRDSFLASLRPVRMPMVVPPIPWTAGDPGGYRFSLRGATHLVRTHDRNHHTQGADLPVVYEALNRMQDTAWEINADALRLLRMIEEVGGGRGGVPEMDDPDAPSWEEFLPRLQAGDMGDVGPHFKVIYDGEEVALYDLPKLSDCKVIKGKLWAPNPKLKRTVDAIYAENRSRWKHRKHQRQSDRATFYRMMSVVSRLEGEPEFFFPYNLDFRGRIYPLPDYLSPQGTDMEKGLLTFARKDPMGIYGGVWLALHLMNCIGKTPDGVKVSQMDREERLDWVDANEARILDYAKAPLGLGSWGLEAEEPVQLYAAACEWARWKEADYGTEYQCGLPIGQDGTCNGLQHFAAMLRDPVAAAAVNVADNDEPQDVYQQVADTVMLMVERDQNIEPLARLWLSYSRPLIDRTRCKRPTMTFPYGSEVFGFTNQLIEEIQKEDDWEAIEQHFGSDLLGACRYLANCIWQALDEVVESAKAAMQWMQKCARIIAKERPLEWTVPGTGFPVRQGYMESDRIRVNTILASGVRIRTDWYEATVKPKVHRQVNAASPNIVHSLDAAHLQQTVVEAGRIGIRSFGMVHDSYATTPGYSQVLADVTRYTFHDLYVGNDVLWDLYDQWVKLTDEELPVPPMQGSFPLDEVLTSPYFFS